jgi:hypothetical protein
MKTSKYFLKFTKDFCIYRERNIVGESVSVKKQRSEFLPIYYRVKVVENTQ